MLTKDMQLLNGHRFTQKKKATRAGSINELSSPIEPVFAKLTRENSAFEGSQHPSMAETAHFLGI